MAPPPTAEGDAGAEVTDIDELPDEPLADEEEEGALDVDAGPLLEPDIAPVALAATAVATPGTLVCCSYANTLMAWS